MSTTEPNPPTLARVFARRTKATPTDALVFFDEPPLDPPEVNEVHVSVTFTWDVPRAVRLARAWERIAPVKIGGPGVGTRGGQFTPGMYLKPGYVITSRGCPNRCWFCQVWRREDGLLELPITDGWNVLDDNLLACSVDHFAAVCDMLRKYRGRVRFTGGLEAARVTPYHAGEIHELRPQAVYMAYDTPDDWEPLRAATDMLLSAGFRVRTSHVLACYVLIGYPRDTMEAAQTRIDRVKMLGLMPYAMLWRGSDGHTLPEWRQLQRRNVRPELIYSRLHENKQQGVLLSCD
jgi:hypothetical protein